MAEYAPMYKLEDKVLLLDGLTDALDAKSLQQENYAFLLVGRSRSGKSSTGNSILGKNVFLTRKPQDSSDGYAISYHISLVDGRSMLVVDGTGIGEAGEDVNEGVNELLQSVDFFMRNEISKFNAIILVHDIHERSQVKMKRSILAIKSILGAKCLRNWGIIVTTYGDLFNSSEDDGKLPSFEDWCQQQTGYFQILLEECNHRCVLFDNKTTDKIKQMEQRNKLMSVVHNMTSKKYTRFDFEDNQKYITKGTIKSSERCNMDLSRDIDLLLIGKTGTGKSPLGNTILRRKVFISKSSHHSVTKNVAFDVSVFDNRVIKVVDVPGVGYTLLDTGEAAVFVMRAMELAISANPRGYHAFLLVVNYGGRFTAEDQYTVRFLKQVFGENFVKNFCILVLTRGDCFENDFEHTGVTFEEWCNEQRGWFKELLEECCHRAILFDNRTRDEAKKEKQLTALIEMVDKLRLRSIRYTEQNFNKSREGREKLMLEAMKPRLTQEIMEENFLLFEEIDWKLETVEQEEAARRTGREMKSHEREDR